MKKILITRSDRIGDLVLSTAVFPEIRKKFPDAWIACLTFLEHREIVEGNPYLNEVILYDKKGSEKGLWGNFLFALALRRKKFDVVVHLHSTNRMHWIGWLAGIPERIGWARKSAWTLTRAFPDRKHEGLKHEAEYNFDLLQPLGVELPQKLETYFPITNRAARSLEQLILHHRIPKDRLWVVLNPSASCPSKIWPPDRFGRLAKKIAERYGAAILVIGTRTDRPLIERIKQYCPRTLFDLSGKLTLGMLGVLLKQSELLISNDSGPVHVATAVRTPVVSIFGRKQTGLSPKRWRPLGEESRVVWKDVGCAVCLAHKCQIHFLCLDAISVEEVMTEIEAMDLKSKMLNL